MMPDGSTINELAGRRVMAYCHDSVGIGHLRRTMAICDRIGREFAGSSFLLATGTPYVPLFRDVDHVDYVKLPALKKNDAGTYGSKFLNITPQRILACRESMLLDAARHFEPGVLLVDKAPLGVCRELVPTLKWLKANRPETRIVFGMRDIEDEPSATIRQWRDDGVADLLDQCFDEVWIYGMREVFDAVREYKLPRRVATKSRYMGYVARPTLPAMEMRSSQKRIVVTVGGGTDGESVLSTFLADAAIRLTREGYDCTVVGGPDLPEPARSNLAACAREIDGVSWVDFEPCMSSLFASARLVVCMGGYNTLCELASLRRRALVIPRIRPRLEQAIRGRCWEARGAVRMLHPHRATPAMLSMTILDMLREHEGESLPLLDLQGLDRVAARFRTFWNKDETNAPALYM
ncbi:MAG: hypothetical protein H6818_00965 [Phycisphaerales bacterium]|nr:hypothetical protein [Phycisphaerales bacterium]